MKESDLKVFVFKEAMKIVAAITAKTGGSKVAFSHFDQIYDALMQKAIQKGLNKD